MNFNSVCQQRAKMESLEEVRRRYIGRVLEATGHDLQAAASLLKLRVPELRRLMRRLSIA